MHDIFFKFVDSCQVSREQLSTRYNSRQSEITFGFVIKLSCLKYVHIQEVHVRYSCRHYPCWRRCYYTSAAVAILKWVELFEVENIWPGAI